MKVARFECIGGASGDMILGAFLDAGLALDELRAGLAKLGVKGFQLDAECVNRGGIKATRAVVRTEEQEAHRSLREIDKILDSGELPERVKERARQAFRKIAEAEAKIHGTTPEEVHFHEVGALDAIVDVVGAMLAVSLMGIERVTVSPFRLGQGTMQIEHGTFPIPAPATLEILSGWPVEFTQVPFELTTPTGAAVLTVLAAADPLPSFRITRVGYGAGTRDLEEVPNVLRLIVGEETAAMAEDRATLLEANIDDMNPELFPHLMDRLFQQGALDVYLTSVVMKKGRPGTVVSALVPSDRVDEAVQIFFRESTTLGVRIHEVLRRKLPRKIVEVDTSLGRVRVKEVETSTGRQLIPEYEECRRLADEKNLPLREVYSRLHADLGTLL
jgi:uncharacterized protein (TIGR00299 family) protein